MLHATMCSVINRVKPIHRVAALSLRLKANTESSSYAAAQSRRLSPGVTSFVEPLPANRRLYSSRTQKAEGLLFRQVGSDYIHLTVFVFGLICRDVKVSMFGNVLLRLQGSRKWRLADIVSIFKGIVGLSKWIQTVFDSLLKVIFMSFPLNNFDEPAQSVLP